MGYVKINTPAQAKSKIADWKSGALATTEQLIFDGTDLDPKDIQLWAFKNDVLIDIQPSIGPFMKLVYVDVI